MKKFETVADVQDEQTMKASLALLRRLPGTAEFMFKARCEALKRKPLLLLAKPGTKVDRNLAKDLREGSKTVYGKVRRRGNTLLFSPRGAANKDEMKRLIARIGKDNGVTLSAKNLIITTQLEAGALAAMEESLRILSRIKKPLPFVFNPRWGVLDGPAFLLGGGSRQRYFSLLRAGSAIEGTAKRADGMPTLFVEKGATNPNMIRKLIAKAARNSGFSVRRPAIVIGGSATQTEEDPRKAPRTNTRPTLERTKATQDLSRVEDDSKAAGQDAAPAPAPAPKQAEGPTAAQRKAEREAKAQRQQEERAAREKAAAEEREQARIVREKAAAERREKEALAKEQARIAQEKAASEERSAAHKAELAKLPKFQRQLKRAVDNARDAQTDFAEAQGGLERDSAALSSLKNIDDAAALNTLFNKLQADITAEQGKPDKDLQKLLRSMPDDDEADEDAIEDAIEECREWLEDRIEEYEDDLDDLRKESETANEERDQLQAKVDGLLALA